ncbi:hypothetical protein HDU79_001610 [Rhizoclosmatium sp. JEL0117]|nr:hypothetical protein HDU79_001610 [Rhizoclosmatium sp. JEL0117]
MGNTPSQGTSTAETGFPSHGYHVLRVEGRSAAAAAGLEAWFDYIVGVDGTATAKEADAALAFAVGAATATLTLDVWSAKTRQLRAIQLSVPDDGSQVGLTARMCALDRSDPRVWRILDVLPNSPAEHAGLRPITDYIVGLPPSPNEDDPDLVLRERDSLFELVESRIGSSITLVVYSSVMDSLRLVELAPRFDWGGPGW